MKRNWIAACGLVLAATALAGTVYAKEEVDRIREKAEELSQKLEGERYSHLGEGKPSNLDRVYRDFDYLLKESKNAIVAEASRGATGPDADRLARLDAFLLHGRIFAPTAASFDNASSYERDAAMSVGDAEVTLQTADLALSAESDRGKRRVLYLASRDLRENFNVFELNLLIDLNRHTNEVAGKTYPEFLADWWHLDTAQLESLSTQVLEATRDEYMTLLPLEVSDALDGLALAEFREYDRPYLLRASHVDDAFKPGKEIDAADRWLKEIGLGIKSDKSLRLKVESKPGMWPDAEVFPIQMGADVRLSLVPLGGLRDYWELFGALGAAHFYKHIDSGKPFEHRRIGAPIIPMVYGALYRNVLGDAGWRAKYLKAENDEKVARAVRFRQLFDLRRDAAHFLFQRRLLADDKTPPTEYVTWMQDQMGYTHTQSEEANYLEAQDLHASGLRVWASVIAAQLNEKLVGQFGAEWWSKPEAAKWLMSKWSRGFEVQASELTAELEIGATDPAAVAAR